MELDHQRLEVYALARELRRALHGLTVRLPRGAGEIRDQATRAALSIKLNIAEGSAEYAAKEKARFYRMARRSASECGALIDDLEDLELITPAQSANTRRLIVRIVSALVRLIQSVERIPHPPKRTPTPTPTPTRKPAPAPARTRTPTRKPTP